MTLHTMRADTVAPQPWRNGGGRTRTLWSWPDGDDWRVRVSLADIDRDGAFSPFPETHRSFAVVDGAGVALDFAERSHVLRHDSPPIGFDGAAPPDCRLIDGPTRDLNLMVRHGSGSMTRVSPGAAWRVVAFPLAGQCGLYCHSAGTWHGDTGESVALQAGTLVWCDTSPGGAWRFVPRPESVSPFGWWLGYHPHRGAP